MIEGIGSAVLQVFKLLTPNEVNRLTETASKRKSNSLSAIEAAEMQLDLDGNFNFSNKAKILPIKKNEEDPYKDNKEEQQEEQKVESKEEVIEEEVKSPTSTSYAVDPFYSNAPTNGNAAVAVNIDYDVDVDLSHDQERLESIGIVSSQKESAIRELEENKKRMSSPSPTMFLLAEREKTKTSRNTLKTKKAIDVYNNTQRAESSGAQDEDDKNKSAGVLVNKKQF